MRATKLIFERYQAESVTIEIRAFKTNEDRYENTNYIKYSFIAVDVKNHKRILFDNHQPKGPHYHVDNEKGKKEYKYKFINIKQTYSDFKKLVKEHMEIML